MRHFHRTSLHPDEVLAAADAFFPTIGMRPAADAQRSRTYKGIVGTPEVQSTLELSVRMEGGHYTFVEGNSDQMGESRLDRNLKKFFALLKAKVDESRTFVPSY